MRASPVRGRSPGTWHEPPSDCNAVLPAHNRGHNTPGHGHIGDTPKSDNDSGRKERTCTSCSPRGRKSMPGFAARWPPMSWPLAVSAVFQSRQRPPLSRRAASARRWRASPAKQPTCACSPVKRLLLAMLTHGCGAAHALLTGSARSGFEKAGRDAGTGTPTEHRNNHRKSK